MLAASCTGMKERVIDSPDLIASNTENLDVSRVELTDSNTVITFSVNFRPKWWIIIDSLCHIVADGKNYAATATDGITLGEKLVMNESGNCEFSITFEPVPLNTKYIDFTEGVDDGWCLWGIDISGKNTGKKDFPDSLPKQLRNTDISKCNLTPVMKAEETVLNFHVLDYRKDFGDKLNLYLSCLGDIYPETVELDSLGNGTFKDVLYGTTRLSATISGLDKVHTSYITLAPGVETDIYIDPRISVRSHMARRDSTFAAPAYCYDNGYYSAFNRVANEIDNYQVSIYNSREPIAPWNCTADEYADSVLSKRSSILNSINSSELGTTLKNYAAAQTDISALQAMTEAFHVLSNYYYYTHADDMRVPKDSIKGLPGDEQYARIAEVIDFENPLFPICPEYDNAIGIDWNKYKPSAMTCEFKRYVQLFQNAKRGSLTDVDLEEAAKMSDPFYADALSKRRQATANAMNRIKNSIQRIPDVTNEKLFEAIIAPHKGKVVLVDLWNTWCGPCRAALKRNEPLKENELSDKDIVWIYIADVSSDINQYNNLISNINGLHYLLNEEQIKYLRSQFEVDGIPYYILVDRKGNAKGHPDFRDPSKFVKGIKTALKEK